jgi:hypothetical protein
LNLVLMRSAHVILRRACPTWARASKDCARLEGRPQARPSQRPSFETAHLRMRSAGLSSIRPIRLVSRNRSSRDQHDSGFARASGTASPASHHGTCVHPQSRIDPAIAAADVWQMRPCLPIGTPDRSARHNRGSFFGSQIPFEPSAPSALSNELRMFCILQDIRPAQAILIVCEPDLRMPAVVFPSAGALRAIAVTSTCRQSDGVPQPSRDIRSH